MTEDYGLPNQGPSEQPFPAAPLQPPLADSTPQPPLDSASTYPEVPQATTLPGGESYRPAPAVMLAPGHGNRTSRPVKAPLIAAGIIGVALLLSAIFVALQLRPIKTVLPPGGSQVGTLDPAAQPEVPTPASDQTAESDTRTYEKGSAEPTIDKAKEAFRQHSPGVYAMVQDKDNPTVKPTSQGLSFTWSYIDTASSRTAEVHTFTVELDDKGSAIDFYSK